jgi:hypothetical protein
MSDTPAQLPTVSVLSWFREVTGDRFLSYLLSCDTEALPALISGETPLTQRQAELATFFAKQHEELLKIEEGSRQAVVCNWLMMIGRNQRPNAVNFRSHVDGNDNLILPEIQEVESILRVLAADSYPGLLLPKDPHSGPMHERFNFAVTRMLYQHPFTNRLLEGLLTEKVFADTYPTGEKLIDRDTTLFRNTGSGGSFQLVLLPELLLARAWLHLEGQTTTPEHFAAKVVEELQVVRRLLSGKTEHVPAKIAFTGVLLPSESSLDIQGIIPGTIRCATDADRKLTPPSLSGTMHSTGEDGVATTINYDGDVIFEYRFPYWVRVMPNGFDFADPWPSGMEWPNSISSVVTRLRFSLMLAVERKARAQIVQAWNYVDTPLNFGLTFSWSDTRQATGISPTQLTTEEVTAWGEWYKLLSAEPVKRIELALTRILRAVAERREPSDVLIDSVIAWENLFGTRGETVFRVTSSLAVLLAESPDLRQEIRKNLKDIYELRSSIVHGSRDLKLHEHSRCHEALDIAIRAVRILISERTDILELSDGAGRSEALLVGGQPERNSSGVEIDVK